MATLLTAIRQKVRARLNETLALTTPGSPLVAAQGTPGSSTVSYAIVATNNTGGTIASQITTITNSAATLSGTNYNQINWQPVPGASGYNVLRVATNGTSPTTTGVIGSTTTLTTLNDTGLAGDSSVAPIVNTSGIVEPYWTEQELLDILIDGCKDLWRAIIDLHQGHFTVILDDGSVVYPAGVSGVTTLFTGVPADCFRILMIEPHDIGFVDPLADSWMYFKPKQYHSQTFQAARAQMITDPALAMTVFYDILNAGSPVAAPTIVGAPPVSTSVAIRLVYVQTLPALVETSNNPIPGESDNALVSWGVAWARAKERDDHSPDPAWFATYSTDKLSLLQALTPRQEQEEEVAEGLFDGLFEDW